MNKLFKIITFIIPIFIYAEAGLCLSGEEIIKLKKAGLSDETIQLMVKEKTVETCAFTAEEIVNLKKAGVSDKTIQMLIKEGSFMKNAGTVVYGKDIKPIKFATVKDIIELKNSGISEKTIQAIISVTGKTGDDIQRERAWEMLKSMEIHVKTK
jgi:alanine-alpha-ketoisovalerate/valine-pyruvate aminotransferase